MYLSRLDLYGFKSFAQRTVVEFTSGVTCVVGPNGCGKTNILDAVRWVLGEQRSATLRSERMESVIFNGSGQRRPLGMAEVSLTIENSRGILPLEYGEIVLTRRLYRSGESEYLMNRQPCRLKDITDLFMDTGMGAGSYSVIELRMVEDLLSDRPEERRQLFEEAAGITKYKHRRRAALRKLEETRQHMTRLEDVVAEAERQVAALRRQVGRTERYRELNRELRETELALAREDLARWSRLLRPLRAVLDEGGLAAARLETELAARGAALSALGNDLLRAEEAVAEGEGLLRARWEECRRLEDEALVTRERLKALDRDQLRLQREAAELEPRLAEGAGRESGLAARSEEARRAQETLDAGLEQAASHAGQAENRLDNLRTRLEQARARVLDLLGRQSRLDTDQAGLAAALEGHRHRRADLETELALLAEDRVARERRRGELEGRARESAAARVAAREGHGRAQAAVEEAREALQGARDGLRELRGEERALAGRRQLLDQVLTRFEGVPGGARTVLEAGLPGVLDLLGNLVHADAARLPALESALGEAALWILVADEAAAAEAAALLRRAGRGACTLALLDRLPAAEEPVPAPAGCRPLLEALRCDGRARPLVEHLLRRAWLVEDEAARPWDHAAPGSLFVLPDGECRRSPFLRRTGGGSGGGHLGLRLQTEQVDAELAALALRAAGQETDLAASEVLLARAREAEDAAAARLGAAEEALRAVERERERLVLEEERAGRDAEGFRRALAELDGRMREVEARERALRGQLEALRGERDEAEGANARLAAQVEEHAGRTRALVEARGAAQVAAAGARLRLDGLGRELEEVRRFLAEGRERLARDAADLSEGEERHARLGARSGELERLQIAAALAREEEERRQETRRAGLGGLRSRQRELREAEDALRAERDAVKDRGHQAELEASGLEARMAALVERIQSEYELTLAPPAAGAGEEGEAEDGAAAAAREESRRRVAELKDAIRRLGPVNLLAIEEHDEESRRAGFLRAQLNDLLEAEAMLQETIGRINRVARELFEETFGRIRTNFEYLFRKLFSDGRADLAMDGEDPLEAEILISATPSGKRIQNLMLMSGGEKTLTAIALLFAIYMVKPSPFCILDEVDAPLDDANIARFNTLIQEFSGMTQFIIITHNKKTMGYADQLYGVTMAEEGVSSLVSVQFHAQA